ncbi:ATPase family AAA domain-containing protein 5 [Anoplophora glabripennis]|uniref:ATPase family AAA domain-containing protein 5 n=1 Tax=Anoplophora glabripennis TaxID=217634 RepID=UPI000C780118|nr:ATPase family AAA domain-containing protein 5 [Anoplophora glabripennis]
MEEIDKNNVTAEFGEIVIVEDKSFCNLPRNQISQKKVNAFQFMMESRNKSIGQNSSGKDKSVDDLETSDEMEHKEVLSARKRVFENWSNKKGAIKRKREEEEKEEMISYKLQKRAKRMKQLLKIDELKDVENDVGKKRRKRSRRISTSSSEDTKDSVIIQDSNEILTNSILEVIEENVQDKVLNESKRRESKQGLLNFFGVVNKSKNSSTVDGVENVTEKEVVKIKLNKSKVKKKIKSNLNTEKTVDKSLKNSIAEESSNEVHKRSKKKKQQRCIKESSKNSKSPKIPKDGTKNDGDGSFTPRSLKSWKIKIKMNNQNNENDHHEEDPKQKRPQRSKRISGYGQLFADESSSEGELIHSQRKKLNKTSEDNEVVCLDEDSNNKKKETPKPIKVAPVFTKATPKPKLAPEIVEARKKFLMSGIPDSLKRTIEKQQSVEEKEYDVFPSISHVQQRCETHSFWDLSSPQLDLKVCSPLKIGKVVMCASLTNSRITSSVNIQKEVEKIDKLKALLNKIKLDNPNYPVYKSFRLIYEKSGKKSEKKEKSVLELKKTKKGHGKKLDKSIEIINDVKPESDSTEHAMWTDKYKPSCSEDIIGNMEGVKTLKKWLEYWKNFSEEINSKKKKRKEYCSDSEFDTTDCDSRDSTKLPDNTIVVGGPCGSGKSTAIYAICNELGFNVIELNASSKRTGKRLLQELQEATQSHQVRKKKHIFESKEDKEQTYKKMCVLLIEDVDVVFEQDDGFISALSQLVGSSKRPVILTTTDTSSVYIQKFISQYQYISFLPLSSQSLATWLQIVCLVEGLFVNQGDVGSLLEFNKGDIRKTLLQLQFWVQSGGQIIRDKLPIKTKAEVVSMEGKLADDEEEPCLEENGKETQQIFVHSDCIRSFEVFKHHKPYTVPYYINLGLLWWNIPNILHIPSFSEDRIKKFKENHFELDKGDEKAVTEIRSKKLSSIEKTKLDSLSKLYDSLAYTDVLFRTVTHHSNLEPDVKNFSATVKDSLELGEVLDGYDGYKDFVHEITHSLMNGYVEEFNNIEKTEPVLDIAMPEKAERRWRAKMHVCEDVFLEALPPSTYIERRSIAADYMPFLRDISRSESRRAANNTKRRNRFRNYLQSLGISRNNNAVKIACNILRE